MSLTGHLVGQISIKSDGDVFHELIKDKPHHIPNISPGHIQGCDLHEGEFGAVGSVLSFNYIHDGKAKVAKDRIEAIDEEKKSMTLKVLEGDLLELYKSFVLSYQVEKKGENNLVTWTFDYEKVNENVEDPNTLMDFCINLTKEIETHHLQQLWKQVEKLWDVCKEVRSQKLEQTVPESALWSIRGYALIDQIPTFKPNFSSDRSEEVADRSEDTQNTLYSFQSSFFFSLDAWKVPKGAELSIFR